MIDRYTERFARSLEQISAGEDAPAAKLDAYAGLYAEVLRDQRMCLCGMLAAEYETLPPPMQEAILRFFDLNEGWLTRIIAQGRRDGTLSFAGTPRDAARSIIDGLEGAMLVSRARGDLARFRSTARRLVASVVGAV